MFVYHKQSQISETKLNKIQNLLKAKNQLPLKECSAVIYPKQKSKIYIKIKYEQDEQFQERSIECATETFRLCLSVFLSQQTFVGLEDVLKTCLEDVFNTSSA